MEILKEIFQDWKKDFSKETREEIQNPNIEIKEKEITELDQDELYNVN